jgi:oligopeptide/dipeptide ABC transporter ATP-binding protein
LIEPSFGRIWFGGHEITHAHERDLRALRRQMQLLFQDAPASLDARMRVSDIVAEPLRIHARQATDAETLQRVHELLGSVGLPLRMLGRRPPELSSGECQRLCLARALALAPRFIVCDEPVAGLDLLEQARITDLLLSLQERRHISYLFISHDLRLVSRLSHSVYVMYAGHIVERGDTELLRQHAAHPYTRALLNAVPELEPKRRRLQVLLEGKPPSPFQPIEGCAFHPRCPRAEPGLCVREVPPLTEMASGHEVACWHPYT